jgi:hypothetical protein
MKALKYLSFVGKIAGLVSALNVIPNERDLLFRVGRDRGSQRAAQGSGARG